MKKYNEINNEINIEMLLDDLIHLERRLVDNYNDDEPFVQYEEDRLCVGNAIDIIKQLKSEQNKVAVEKLENIGNWIGYEYADTYPAATNKIIGQINSILKELKGESDE